MNTVLIPLLNHSFDQTRSYFKTKNIDVLPVKSTKTFFIYCIDVDGKWYKCCKKGEPEYLVHAIIKLVS
jgi:hypothetical protein